MFEAGHTVERLTSLLQCLQSRHRGRVGELLQQPEFQSQGKSPLLSLPQELRDTILQMALKLHVQGMPKPFELPTTIVSENEIYRRSVKHNERNGIKTTASFVLNSRPIPAFAQACRRICLETIAIIILDGFREHQLLKTLQLADRSPLTTAIRLADLSPTQRNKIARIVLSYRAVTSLNPAGFTILRSGVITR